MPNPFKASTEFNRLSSRSPFEGGIFDSARRFLLGRDPRVVISERKTLTNLRKRERASQAIRQIQAEVKAQEAQGVEPGQAILAAITNNMEAFASLPDSAFKSGQNLFDIFKPKETTLNRDQSLIRTRPGGSPVLAVSAEARPPVPQQPGTRFASGETGLPIPGSLNPQLPPEAVRVVAAIKEARDKGDDFSANLLTDNLIKDTASNITKTTDAIIAARVAASKALQKGDPKTAAIETERARLALQTLQTQTDILGAIAGKAFGNQGGGGSVPTADFSPLPSPAASGDGAPNTSTPTPVGPGGELTPQDRAVLAKPTNQITPEDRASLSPAGQLALFTRLQQEASGQIPGAAGAVPNAPSIDSPAPPGIEPPLAR